MKCCGGAPRPTISPVNKMNGDGAVHVSKVWGLQTDLPDCESRSRKCPTDRLFVNRSLSLDTIRFYGFDMDYTLAEYNTTYMEAETAKYAFERLVELGYPKELLDTEFKPDFAVRGLVFDRKLGTFLKLDLHGLLLTACIGTRKLSRRQIREEYPTKFCKLAEKTPEGESRFLQLFDTLFDTPKIFVVSTVIDWLENSEQYQRANGGYFDSSTLTEITYSTVWNDVKLAFDMVHMKGPLHRNIMQFPEQFILRNPMLPKLLDYLHDHGKKVFLLTNSPYNFTDIVMKYILGDLTDKPWTDYFDFVIVKACKPTFFNQGTPFRHINQKTGAANIGLYKGETMKQGEVYSGGNCDLFCQMTGAEGPDILYFGDHIYGDVVRSKKTNGWKTFLCVPELNHELDVWTRESELFERHHALERKLAQYQESTDTDHTQTIRKLDQERKQVVDEIDSKYNPYFGSMFRKGGRLSCFANQMDRYADVYSTTINNIIKYSLSHQFWSPPKLLPHEATVAQDD